MIDIGSLARALGGEIAGDQVICSGPGHSPRDRSLSVRLDPDAPGGLLVHSFAGDDWHQCREHVRERVGLPRGSWKSDERRPIPMPSRAPAPARDDRDDKDRIANAMEVWRASVDPRGTLAQTYLSRRGLDLSADIAGAVLRWNARLGALVALFRNVHTGEPQAVSRTFIDSEGRKLGRKFLGPVGAAAVMLDGHADVVYGLHIGEGVETTMAARQMGLKPAWALGSAGAIARFPVLAGVDVLTVFAETDDAGANARAIEEVGARWRTAGCEIYVVTPKIGGDMNDVVMAREAGK